MNKALIIYHSKSGTTRKFSYEIAQLCEQVGLKAKAISIEMFNANDINGVDYLFLGCWTHGHLVFNQHPESEWVEFAKKLPTISDKKIVLFTTYKVATGSMFRKMKKHLNAKPENIQLKLKSRSSKLSSQNALAISNLLKLNAI